MTARPGEFQRPPWRRAPSPLSGAWRESAMRKKRMPLRSGGEAVERAHDDVLDLARAELGERGFDGLPAVELRVRRREEALRLRLVVPEHLGEGDHAREPLRALALDELQALAALPGRGGHDAMHQLHAGGALDAGALDDALEALLRQARLDGLGDVGDGADIGPKAQDAGDAIGRDGHGIVTSCRHYRLI